MKPAEPAPAHAPNRGSGTGQTLRWLLSLMAVGLTVALLLAAIGLWLMGSASGSRWLLAHAPGLQTSHTEGALLGGEFKAEGVRWQAAATAAEGPAVHIKRLSWRGLRWDWLPGHGAWLGLQIAELEVGDVELQTGPTNTERWRAPGSLRTPVALDIQRLQISSLKVDAFEPAHDLQARLSVGRLAGGEHSLELKQLRWQQVLLQGQGSIKTDVPYALNMQLQAQAPAARVAGTAWTAQAEMQGPLSSALLKLKLTGKASDNGTDPSLDAQAQIRPFEAWALGDVDVTTRGLDLASLMPGAPRTRLSGHALVRSRSLREPIQADIQFDNAIPARFSDGGLPLLALRASIKANPKQPDKLDIGPFELEAADTRGAAGRWSGSGTWQGDRLDLQSKLTELQPARLDSRLAVMQLSGPLNIKAYGLPRLGTQPGSGVASNPQAPSAGSAGSPASAAWAGWRAVTLEAEGQLEGRVSAAPDLVRLSFNTELDQRGVHVKNLLARSGAAQAQLTAQVTRLTPQRWQLASEGELKAFDPRVWFPGTESTWGTGQHVFNGRWAVDLSAPAQSKEASLASAAPMAPAQWLPLLLGRADLKLFDSRLAGLPLQAEMELRQAARDSRDTRNTAPSRAKVDIRLASAQLQLTGSGDASESGTSDRTQIKLSVPALADLAPLTALWPAWRAWSPRRGELQLQADLSGRWPSLNGQVQAQATGVQAGPLSLQRALLEGQLGQQGGDNLKLRVEADELIWNEARLNTLRGQLQGSLAQHRIELQLRAPLLAPTVLARALDWQQSGQARADVAGKGSWATQPGDRGYAGRWSGQLDRLQVSDAKRVDESTAARSWLDLQNVLAEVRLDTAGQVQTVGLQPGTARSGPLELRWTEAQWQRVPGAPAEWRLLGELEPVLVAPLLQRAMGPTNGSATWGGDLRVGARLDLRADSRFAADVRLQRESGDLVSIDAGAHTALGLEQAELRGVVKDGLWRIQPLVNGRTLGRIEGELLARAQPAQRWPAPATPIDGAVQARVASLATWARWLPTGWTVQGELDGMARLSGTWAAPAYTGALTGERVAVRNLLQGVDFKDGQLKVRLDGETARIETLSLRGGDGLLSAQGLAHFGNKPELKLQAKADKLRVLGRVDRQLVLSGQAQLQLTTERLNLDGQITADSGLFDLSSRDAPSLDEDVTVHRQELEPAPAASPRAEASPWAKQARVTLDLDLGKQLHLRGRGLNTDLSGKLRLTTPGGRMNFQGAVQAEGGTYAAYGQKLEIERGQVSFNGPLDRTRLDVLALRPNLDMRVGVVITGNTLDPRVRLFSEPEMSESDKLSWLVLGRGPEGLGTTDTALLQRAAMALLAGEGESPSDAALRRIGLDEFSIRQTDGDVRETVVTVGKQLSRRWFVGYERGVNATEGTWQLVYRIAQRFTLRAQSGSDNSLDVIWTWRFGQP